MKASWSFEAENSKKEVVKSCERERERLLDGFRKKYPRCEFRRPAEVLKDVIADICGFRVAPRTLMRGQLAICDFQTKIVTYNSQMTDFVHNKTNIKTLVNSTLAHELGHICLHADEMEMRETVSYYNGTCETHTDPRHAYREREADLFAAMFLVPKEQLLLEQEGARVQYCYKEGEKLKSSTLWRFVYQLARKFQVSPSLMRRCLIELGWVEPSGDGNRKQKGLQISRV